MKKVLALLLLFAGVADAQVPCSLFKKTANGGLECATSNDSTRITPYYGTSAPSAPNWVGQVWYDTTTSPAKPKRCTTVPSTTCTVWETNANNITIQSNFNSFPSASAGDGVLNTATGQMSFTDGLGNWWAVQGSKISASYTDTYGAVITSPASAPSVSAVGSGGSFTSGTHCFKVAFINSTGGATTLGPASSCPSFATNGSASLTSIPTGGAGTTGRDIYMTKAGVSSTGEYYWALRIADNTATTGTVIVGDGSLVMPSPKTNYSGALSSKWTYTNNTGTNAGGCGSTGTGVIIAATNVVSGWSGGITSNAATAQNDVSSRCAFDVSAWNGSDYTLNVRIVGAGIDTSTLTAQQFGTVASCGSANAGDVIVGFRVGSTDGGVGWKIAESKHQPKNDTVTVWSVANSLSLSDTNRTTIGGQYVNSGGGFTARNVPVLPTASGYPYYLRFKQRSGKWSMLSSVDGVVFTPFVTASNGISTSQTSSTTVDTNTQYAAPPGGPYTQFELEMYELNLTTGCVSSSSGAALNGFGPHLTWVDSISVTVP
jgi:hypothetical protein